MEKKLGNTRGGAMGRSRDKLREGYLKRAAGIGA